MVQSHVVVDGPVSTTSVEGTWAMVGAIATAVGAIGTLIAAVAAGLALWFNFIPWCDLVNVAFTAVESDNAVQMSAAIHNAGGGQVTVAFWKLESYEGMADLPHATQYLGPLFPRSRRRTQHTVQLPRPVQQIVAPNYSMMLRWYGLFGVYGETLVEANDVTNVRKSPKRISLYWNPRLRRKPL